MLELWAEMGARAGIRIHPTKPTHLTPHSGRHTFSRLIEEAGFSSFWIARLRGDTQVSDRELASAWTYAKRSPNDIRTAYLERFPRLPVDGI